MKSKKKALKIISQKLKGIKWVIFSGTAIEIYTNRKREGKDIDVLIPWDKIDEVAKRFNTTPKLRTFKKGNIEFTNDHYIETVIDGIAVEILSKTEKIIINGKQCKTMQSLAKSFSELAIKKKYLGVDIFIERVEEIIASKMVLDRPEDLKDEKDINLLLKEKNTKINKKYLIRALDRWGTPKKEQEYLLKKFNIC